jgi:2'-5' RNA ligase
MPRLFTGLEIPSSAAMSLASLRGGLPGARWIDPENYHVTLRFMGDIDDRTADTVAELLAGIHRRPFDLAFEGLGAFGGNRPRAVYAAVKLTPALAELQAEQERLCRAAGLEPEGRRFTPHVTLARLRDVRSHAVAEYLATRGGFRVPSFRVQRFVLFSSKPSTGGGPYVIEEAYPLHESRSGEAAATAAW